MNPRAVGSELRWLGRALVDVGVGGAALTAICCFAPVIAAGLLTAVGLGFILNDSALIGLLIISLGIAAAGLYILRRRRHG